jgi:glucose-1-phosphate adenylyltransferase
MTMHDVTAVILGGGRGSRLYPLTRERAKPAVPLAGKYRLIDIPISNCINSGINRIFVLTQFMTASLHRHIVDTYKFDIFSHGFVEVLSAEQTLTRSDWYQGTADAVRQQLHQFARHDPRDVIILSGDHLYRMDYAKFINYHRDTGADITVAVLPVTEEDAARFGILRADDEGRIVRFVEKPRTDGDREGLASWLGDPKPYLGSMGIYVFRKDVLPDLLQGDEEDFGKHIIPMAIDRVKVMAFPFEGYWEDIGTIRSFYETNLALAQPTPPFDFYEAIKPIYTRSRFLPPSRVEECRLARVALAEGSWLSDSIIEDSVLGLRSMVWQGCTLRRVVMMGADYYQSDEELAEDDRCGRPHIGIGRNCEIEGAIIDKNARIGNHVVIRPQPTDMDVDGDSYVVRDGIVVIPLNAVIPEGTVI